MSDEIPYEDGGDHLIRFMGEEVVKGGLVVDDVVVHVYESSKEVFAVLYVDYEGVEVV